MDRCWAYCLAYNERVLMPYWVRHYRTFCERLIVCDHRSDDGTAALAARLGADVRPYESATFDDTELADFATRTYREARGHARWIVWADADELVFHPRIGQRLDALEARGVTVPQVEGYCMVADRPPPAARAGGRGGRRQLYDLPGHGRGFRASRYDKPCVVNPAIDVTWHVGRHELIGAGVTRNNGGDDPLRLLHYRWFGRTWCEARNARNYARMSSGQQHARLGYEVFPGASGPYTPDWYEAQTATAQEVVG